MGRLSLISLPVGLGFVTIRKSIVCAFLPRGECFLLSMVRPEHVTDQEKPSAQECCWHSMPSAHTLADLTPSHLHFSEDSWKVLGLLSGQVQHQLWYLFLKIFPLLIIPPDNICIEVLSPVCESCQKKAVSDRDEMFDCETDYPAA